MNTQDWSPLGWSGWISLLSKGLSGVFSFSFSPLQIINDNSLNIQGLEIIGIPDFIMDTRSSLMLNSKIIGRSHHKQDCGRGSRPCLRLVLQTGGGGPLCDLVRNQGPMSILCQPERSCPELLFICLFVFAMSNSFPWLSKTLILKRTLG